jgi:hypothetical protein
MMSSNTLMSNAAVRTAAAAAALVLLAGCSSQQDSPDPNDPGIGHIHGLGVDPSDGSVYIAAHYGLFQVAGKDRATRVAGRSQDHMGFTVAGPKNFLASGHPAAADIPPGGSPHLGLIRSTDAGVTWAPVSMAGKADFHALQLAGTRLYGYDSQTGRLNRSTDAGRTWIVGAQLQVIDLAAHFGEPDKVYATTPENLQISDDGGKSFRPAPSSPALAFLDEPEPGLLVGAAAGGQVHISQDAGRTWKVSGSVPGAVTAFTAVDQTRLLAATDGGTVYESRDGGKTFAVVFQPAQG